MPTAPAFHGLLRFASRTVSVCAWLYLIGVVAVGIILRTAGERWWPATVMLFAPRWIWAAPLAVLAPAAVLTWGLGVRDWMRRIANCKLQIANCKLTEGEAANNPKSEIKNPKSAVLPIVLAAVWVAWPLMGFCCSWSVVRSQWSVAREGTGNRVQGSGEEKAEGRRQKAKDGLGRPSSDSLTPNHQPLSTIRVLTCNVGLDGYDEQALARLIDETQPDVVTLQEGGQWPVVSSQLPGNGQRTTDNGPSWYTSSTPGIFLASRFPIVSQQVLQREDKYSPRAVGVAYQLNAPGGPFTFVALHLYTPRKGLMSTPTRPWHGNPELEANTAWRVQESADVAKWVAGLPGAVIVAGDMNLTPESEIFRRDWSRYSDAFSAAGLGYGYTYGYDASRPFWGIRIDHVLADSRWRVERCWVGPHIHSDHRPVLADLVRGQ